MISERTKAALKAARARGVRFGAEVLAPKLKEEARQRAVELEPVITELKGKGLSLAKIAGELNKRKVTTPRGGRCCAECSESPPCLIDRRQYEIDGRSMKVANPTGGRATPERHTALTVRPFAARI